MQVTMRCLIAFLAVAALTSAAPRNYFDDDFFNGFTMPGFDFTFPTIPKVSCQSLGCPTGTNACSRQVTTSNDRKTINTTIKCFQKGQIIHEDSKSKPNPDPNSQVNEYEYYGSYTGENTSINIENNTGNVPDDKIETLSR